MRINGNKLVKKEGLLSYLSNIYVRDVLSEGVIVLEIIDNINRLLGDDLKKTIKTEDKLSIVASCFSIYAYESLKKELEQVEELRFIFNSLTFIKDKIDKEKREFYIPKLSRERSLYGTKFEIKLKNDLA